MLGLFGSTWRPVRHKRRDVVDLTWLSARAITNQWYPQGVDLGVWQGRRTLAVSWFRKNKAGRHLASRVTLIDLERSRHLDIALTVEGDHGELQPAQIHAGGLAWFGDRLFVAATGQGIWEFDLRNVRRLHRSAARRVVGTNGRGIGAVALAVVRTHVHPVRLRCSFIGRAFDSEGAPLRRVLIGEYRDDERGRVGEFSVPLDSEDGFARLGEVSPGIRHMQGAVRWGDDYLVSQSDGLRPGALWTGAGEKLHRSPIALPAGCEDLALDPDGGMLWSLGEHPWRRVVRGLPFALLGV